MKYTYKKAENQIDSYVIYLDNNGSSEVFTVGGAKNEVEIDELVKLHVEFMTSDQTPSITYAKQRQAEYPPVADQLDTLYHGGYDAWKAEIQAIKDKYPKS